MAVLTELRRRYVTSPDVPKNGNSGNLDEIVEGMRASLSDVPSGRTIQYPVPADKLQGFIGGSFELPGLSVGTALVEGIEHVPSTNSGAESRLIVTGAAVGPYFDLPFSADLVNRGGKLVVARHSLDVPARALRSCDLDRTILPWMSGVDGRAKTTLESWLPGAKVRKVDITGCPDRAVVVTLIKRREPTLR